MIQNLRVRWTIILIVLFFGIVWTVPNFLNTDKNWWPTKSRMVLGLDIQGGSHLVLRVDVDSAVKQDTNRYASTLKHTMEEQKTPVKDVTVIDPATGALKISLLNPSDAGGVQATLDKYLGNTFKVDSTTPEAVQVVFNDLYIREFKARLIEQAIAVIRNRIDEFGVAEPSITAQGTDHILVQLPGIKDASSAKELINKTARLDFMLVAPDMEQAQLSALIAEAEKTGNFKLQGMKYSQYVDKLNTALKGKIPDNTIVYFEKPDNALNMEAGRQPFLLRTTDNVSGGRLTNAQVGMGEYGAPIVSFQFDNVGAKEFGDMTTRNVRKPMAIVLDKVVKSVANINEPITRGSGQITLGRGKGDDALKDAKLIATALRAGALPAALEQLEERTVGPSLGRDAIHKGEIATIAAALAVFLFMGLYYKTFGLIADIALALNLLLTIAILSSLGATLSLPGVAGMALTLGISVDASVIIYERVKEEMRKGKLLMPAIREGYDRAFSSILDANLTSIAVCVVLMYYGTGPIRGFAITLLTGLVITTFTAVFFTRAIFDLLVGKWKVNLSPN
jgi:preprotein translocase subunit SecD